MRRSWGTPSLSSVSAAWRMVSQSDWLPMMMPTAGPRTGKVAPRRGVEPAGAAQAAAEIDPLTIAGIGEGELTPKLRPAIMGLLAEVDQLRRDLGEARARIGYLERLADEDPLM